MLNFYNKEIREAMIEAAKDREIGVRYGEGFGKRPDILVYPDEILDLVKQKASSFHSSEERWDNPTMISTNMRKKDLDNLRKGWDLILDIDSPFWKISKITAWLIIQGLKDFNIKSISVKFSGNKGFHIGVPFESFPKEFQGDKTKNLFPEIPKNIASFLLDYITEKYISVKNNNEIIFGHGLKKTFKISYSKLKELTGKKVEDLTLKICSSCKNTIESVKTETSIQFVCPKCSKVEGGDEQFKKCKKCNVIMEKIEFNKSICPCGSNDYFIKFNPLSIIEVDTLLISSRHMFRMPYSMHEKSGLVSLPFNPDKILLFEKKFANPEIVKLSKFKFIDRNNVIENEASDLLEKAMEFGKEKEKNSEKTEINFEEIGEAIPETLFPPCIKKILAGVEDGRKRALFILINFLKCVGWPYDKIEERIREWNEKNPEALKEQIVIGQLRYQKTKGKILPPNCNNKTYYKDFQVCLPDNFCSRIKNPVNYAIIKAKMGNKKNN